MTRLDRAPSGCAVLPRKDLRREKIFRAALLGALRADDFEDRFNQPPHNVTGEQLTTDAPTVINICQNPMNGRPRDARLSRLGSRVALNASGTLHGTRDISSSVTRDDVPQARSGTAAPAAISRPWFKALATRLGLDDKCISGSGLH